MICLLAFTNCERAKVASVEEPKPVGTAVSAEDIEFSHTPKEAPPPESVEVKPVTKIDEQMTGRLTWDEDYTGYVFSPLSGRVDKIVADIGQKVAAGDDLAWLHSPDYAQAQADYRTAMADLTQGKENLDRQNALRARGAASVQDLEAAQAGYDQALAEKQRAESRLKQLGTTQGDFSDIYHVRSPLAGMIVDKKVNPGQEVRADIQLAGVSDLVVPMYTITDPTHLWLQLAVPEGQLNLLKRGQTVEFRTSAYPDRVFTGKLAVVGASLDPQTRVAYARAAVDNPEGLLKAEMYVTVNLQFPDGATPAVEVPSRAVFFRDGKYYVLVENKQKFEPRQVTVEHESSAGATVVVRGLEAGRRVAGDANQMLRRSANEDVPAALATTKSHGE